MLSFILRGFQRWADYWRGSGDKSFSVILLLRVCLCVTKFAIGQNFNFTSIWEILGKCARIASALDAYSLPCGWIFFIVFTSVAVGYELSGLLCGVDAFEKEYFFMSVDDCQ